MMVSVSSLILCITTTLLFIPIQSNFVHQFREKRKRRNPIAEFDLSTEENLSLSNIVHRAKDFGGKLETKLGRSYELLGHKVADLGSQLEENKNDLADKATKIYAGPVADKTGAAYENFQYGYGKMGDGLSSILHWLGQNVIKTGHNTGSLIRSGFHTIGDIIGDTVDKTEHLIGTGLIKGGEKVHAAGKFYEEYSSFIGHSLIPAIDLQRTSHQDSENLRHKFQESAPKFEQTLTRAIGKLGQKLHTIGLDTETAGEVMEEHHFLDTLNQAYHD